MTLHHPAAARRSSLCAQIGAALTLAFALLAPCAHAQTQTPESKSADAKASAESYKTIYLTNATQQNDLNEITTDLRNMLNHARVYGVGARYAISIHGTSDDVALAEKVIADLDRPKKIYRLTYSITESDSGKRIGTQHVALIVVAGSKSVLKQGNRVPLVTGTVDAGTSTPTTQVQYIDIGLNIEASIDGPADGLELRTKIEQSSIADEKSGLGLQDPIVRQTQLESASTLIQGKPLVIGSLDIPGTTRHLDIEVVSEPAR